MSDHNPKYRMFFQSSQSMQCLGTGAPAGALAAQVVPLVDTSTSRDNAMIPNDFTIFFAIFLSTSPFR